MTDIKDIEVGQFVTFKQTITTRITRIDAEGVHVEPAARTLLIPIELERGLKSGAYKISKTPYENMPRKMYGTVKDVMEGKIDV